MSVELDMRRRRLLLGGICAGISAFAGGVTGAPRSLSLPSRYASASEAEAFWSQPRVVNLLREKTGEHSRVCFWRDGALDANGYRDVCTILRDVRAGKIFAMDLRLLNLICGMQAWLYSAYGITDPYVVTSGYRTLQTNATTEGAAKNSLHMRGMAFDGRIPGLPVEYLGKLFTAFQSGGVGFYLDQRNFIHADVGRVRTWRKK